MQLVVKRKVVSKAIGSCIVEGVPRSKVGEIRFCQPEEPNGGIALSFFRTGLKANGRGPQLKKNPLFATESRGTRTLQSRSA